MLKNYSTVIVVLTAVSGTNSAAINTSATVAGNSTTSGTYDPIILPLQLRRPQVLVHLALELQPLLILQLLLQEMFPLMEQQSPLHLATPSKGFLKKINAETETTGVTATLDTTDASNKFIKLTDDSYGSDSEITLAADNATLTGLFNATANTTATSVKHKQYRFIWYN